MQCNTILLLFALTFAIIYTKLALCVINYSSTRKSKFKDDAKQ